MKPKEYIQIYNSYKRQLSNIASQTIELGDYIGKEKNLFNNIKSLYEKLITEFNNCDFTQFNTKELELMDWSMWDENIILMPIWSLDCLPDKQLLYSISNKEVIYDKSKGLDKDVRFGVTAYGLNKSQLRDAAIESILN